MKRRRLVAAACCWLATGQPWRLARAQTARVQRIGVLSGGTASDARHLIHALEAGLQELGYRQGEAFTIDARYAEYSAERAEALAAELAALKPLLIVAQGTGIRPAYRLNPPVPVVFLHSGDPIVAGYADTLARPGRHATGVSVLSLDLIPKRLELLAQIKPGLRRVAFLASPQHPGQQQELKASRAAAEGLRMTVDYHEVSTPAELAAALPVVAAQQPGAAMLFSDALMVGQRTQLAAFFIQHRIPSAAGWVGFPESGHLLSYGADRAMVWRRLASFVDKIVRGTPPGELPIELPTVIEMALNRRTAAAMNLVLPPAVLLRADRVFD